MKRKPMIIAISLDADRNVLSAHALTNRAALDVLGVDHSTFEIADDKWDTIKIQFAADKRVTVTIMEQR